MNETEKRELERFIQEEVMGYPTGCQVLPWTENNGKARAYILSKCRLFHIPNQVIPKALPFKA